MDVVVVGSCNADLTSYAPCLPQPGETLHGHKFVQGFGGKGANQCVLAARLGVSTGMVAKVGSDQLGQSYIQNLKDNKVNVDHVSVTSEASTGVAQITVSDNGQNSIIIVCGANLLLSEEDVLRAEDMISKAKVIVCQLETKPETSLAALKLARKHGVTTIFNPAPAQKELDPELYKNCDIFCPNETEAEILTGQSIHGPEDAGKTANILLDRGCQMVIVTLGAKGAVVVRQSDRAVTHIPATKVTPVDTTGAGDAFVGALAFYLANHTSLELPEIVRRAGQIATVSVQAEGTQTSFPWKKDLPQEMFSS